MSEHYHIDNRLGRAIIVLLGGASLEMHAQALQGPKNMLICSSRSWTSV